MTDDPIRLAIVGAAGRMGTALLDNAADRPQFEVRTAVVNPSGTYPDHLGPQDVPTTGAPADIEQADVAIDFSVPEAFVASASRCAEIGVPLVSGTTGLSPDQWDEIDAFADQIPLLYAANFSAGINVLADLVGRAASALGEGADIEIFEAHHRNKVDAPSGTAKMLGEMAADARGQDLDEVARWAREGHTGERSDDEIGFQVLRGGDIVGEHTAYLCIEGERIELTHRSTDRGIFARGALRAARWITDRPAGRYDMTDVLFED